METANANTIHVPYNEQTAHIYETMARIKQEILYAPTPRQWEMLKAAHGDSYTLPRPMLEARN